MAMDSIVDLAQANDVDLPTPAQKDAKRTSHWGHPCFASTILLLNWEERLLEASETADGLPYLDCCKVPVKMGTQAAPSPNKNNKHKTTRSVR